MTKTSSPTFLVTGVGGDIGLSIGKILRDLYPNARLIGTDLHDDHPWKIFFDELVVLPGVSSKQAYLDAMSSLVKMVKPEFLIPTSEPELKYFNTLRIKTINEVPVIMANYNSMDIGFDKLKTAEFLRSEGLPHPWTKVATVEVPTEFPFIFKARSGSGSNSVMIIKDEKSARVAMADVNPADYIFQQYIPNEDQEFTCGLFRGMGRINTFILKRRLKGDLTGSGVVVDDKNIESLLHQIAEKLDLQGSINVQLRLDKNGLPLVFEINPRFSSTVCFRHLLGFQDLKWSLDLKKNMNIPEYNSESSLGKKIYRVWSEYII